MIQRRFIIIGLCAAFGLPRRQLDGFCTDMSMPLIPAQELLDPPALALAAGKAVLRSPLASPTSHLHWPQDTIQKLQLHLDRVGLMAQRMATNDCLRAQQLSQAAEINMSHRQAVSIWRLAKKVRTGKTRQKHYTFQLSVHHKISLMASAFVYLAFSMLFFQHAVPWPLVGNERSNWLRLSGHLWTGPGC